MKNINWKSVFSKVWPHCLAIIFFYLLAAVYFGPAVFGNKELPQGDVQSSFGMGKDAADCRAESGEDVYWSNAMFSGMPHNYAGGTTANNIFNYATNIFELGLPHPHAGLVFILLAGFYLLMLSLGCNVWLSVIGAIAYAFVSFNLVSIEAGHVNKVGAMATMAPVIAGVIWTYRKKYLLGAFVTIIFAGWNFMWMHQQISYYLGILLIFIAISYLIEAIKSKQLKSFWIASAILIGSASISALPTAGKLISSADYVKESMRGGNVLSSQGDNATNAGLERDYAFQWSYGKAETMTLLIPNFFGGSSHYSLGRDSESYDVLRSSGQADQFCKHAPTYWGAQPFTSGPVYAGAIVCFLFVLGLFVVKGAEKWWILAATIVSVLLCWGGNLPGINNFLFDHLPLYNKFRTPAMALCIANVTMAVLAVLTLKEFAGMQTETPNRKSPDKDFAQKKQKTLKYLYISSGIVGGICLLVALFGGIFFDFSAQSDANFPDWLQAALQKDRKQMLTSDAWRSFVFIALAFGIMWLYLKKSVKPMTMYVGILVLVLVDLWSVDKRFLNDDNFVRKEKVSDFVPTEADKVILEDKDPDFRVLNLTSNTFNESTTSYWHKSIGGYSPAKLRRYQDIIDHCFSGRLNMSVLNMLNTKYVIVSDNNGQLQAQRNPEALGNAWFVDSICWVNGPDEEIAALADFNPTHVAFVDTAWRSLISDASSLCNPTEASASIKLTQYLRPDHLIYESENSQSQLAVFSEVFYKTWRAYIDGNEVKPIRVNYILRGLPVPAGKHTIEFRCIDDVFIQAKKISKIGNILVASALVLLLAGMFFRWRRSENKETKKLNS